jgi:hypothetical protein
VREVYVENGFSSAQIRQALLHVLASRQFSEAPRLSEFLKHIVEISLAGQSDGLKEYSIATEVFHRPATFDPRLDTIVRVQATKLRSKLAEYYASDGAASTIRIELPRGSYVPLFKPRDADADSASEQPSEAPVTKTHPGSHVAVAGYGGNSCPCGIVFCILAKIEAVAQPNRSIHISASRRLCLRRNASGRP